MADKLQSSRLDMQNVPAQIAVIGMHRSGTSAVAGALAAMGASVGGESNLMRPSSYNQLGYFERTDAHQICNNIMRARDSAWWKVSDFEVDEMSVEVREAHERKVLALIKDLNSSTVQNGSWVLKEPMLAFLLPIFRRFLVRPEVVIVYRSPVEVAKSLRRRNGFSMEAGLALWEAYNVAALRNTNDLPRSFVPYESLLKNPRDVLRRVAVRLEELGVTGLDIEAGARAVRSGLRQESAIHPQDDLRLTSSQKGLWDALETEKVPEFPSLSECAFRSLRDFEVDRFVFEELQKDKNSLLKELESTKEKAGSAKGQLDREKQSLNEKVAGLEAELQVSEQQTARFRRQTKKLDELVVEAKGARKTLEKSLNVHIADSIVDRERSRLTDAELKVVKAALGAAEQKIDELKLKIVDRAQVAAEARSAAARANTFEKLLSESQAEVTAISRRAFRAEETNNANIEVIRQLRENSDQLRRDMLELRVLVRKSDQDRQALEKLKFDEAGQRKKIAETQKKLRCLEVEISTEKIRSNEWKQQISQLKKRLEARRNQVKGIQGSFWFVLYGYAASCLEPFKNFGRNRHLHRQARQIASLGIFDSEAYLIANPDVAEIGIDPILHFLRVGWHEGRSAGPSFDEKWYLSRYPDVAAVKMNPLVHYAIHGVREGRVISPTKREVDAASDGGGKEIFSGATIRNHIAGDGVSRRSLGARTLRSHVAENEGDFALLARDWYDRNQANIDDILVSIVLPVFDRGDLVSNAIASVQNQAHTNWELLITDDGSTDRSTEIVEKFCKYDKRIKLFKEPHQGVSAARNKSLKMSNGEIIAYIDADNSWKPEYLRSMVSFMHARNLGCAYSSVAIVGGDGALQKIRGEPFSWERCVRGNFIDLNVYCHTRTVLNAEGGFDESLRRTVDWDIILRQTKNNPTEHANFTGANYSHDESDIKRISISQPYVYRRIVQLKNSGPALKSLQQVADELPFRIGIKIPAPENKREEWGDYHFAHGLADSLKKYGHEVRIHFLGDWHECAVQDEDVSIVIRGLTKYEARPGQLHVMWNISHPDQVGFAEYDSCDLVYAASSSYAVFLTEIIGNKVSLLWQATDTNRFSFVDGDSEKFNFDVLFVGNSRKQYRNIVRYAVEEGLQLSIYGTNWENYVPSEFLCGPSVPNDELCEYYAAANVVLNDHWESMRVFGFVSNRLFDVAAVGTQIVTDPVPSARMLFGNSIIEVDSREGMSSVIGKARSDSAERKQSRKKLSRQVCEHHSFDRRAEKILLDIYNQLKLPAPKPLKSSEAKFAAPYIARNKPIRVRGIVRKDREFPQSSAFLRLLCPLTAEALVEKIEFSFIPARDVLGADLGDLSIVQRVAFDSIEDAERGLDKCNRNGTRLIVDTDDALGLVDKSHPEYDFYREKNEIFERTLQYSSGLWVSTNPLVNLYKSSGSTTALVENALDPRLWHDYRKSSAPHAFGRTVKFLYTGTATHDDDFALILPALDRLYEECPGRFSLTLIGAVRRPPLRPWLNIVKPPSICQSYPRFVRWLRSQGPFDVGLAPLVESPFNNCKSDLKYLDYLALGLFPIVSDVSAYRATLTAAGVGELIPGSADAWFKSLRAVLDLSRWSAEEYARGQEYLWSDRSLDHTSKKQHNLILNALEG